MGGIVLFVITLMGLIQYVKWYIGENKTCEWVHYWALFLISFLYMLVDTMFS